MCVSGLLYIQCQTRVSLCQEKCSTSIAIFLLGLVGVVSAAPCSFGCTKISESSTDQVGLLYLARWVQPPDLCLLSSMRHPRIPHVCPRDLETWCTCAANQFHFENKSMLANSTLCLVYECRDQHMHTSTAVQYDYLSSTSTFKSQIYISSTQHLSTTHPPSDLATHSLTHPCLKPSHTQTHPRPLPYLWQPCPFPPTSTTSTLFPPAYP